MQLRLSGNANSNYLFLLARRPRVLVASRLLNRPPRPVDNLQILLLHHRVDYRRKNPVKLLLMGLLYLLA
jgi:hypothetical protein